MIKKTPITPPPQTYSQPDVFIIESLKVADEVAERFEGKVLAQMLRLAGKTPAYYYFRSIPELIELASLFRLSNYRFLHISCHGSDSAIYSTLDEIPFKAFAKIFKDKLKTRRVFVSACEVGSGMLGDILFSTNKGMHSVASPIDKIAFDKAAAIWFAFYARLFSLDVDAMKHSDIQEVLTHLCNLFGVRFNWSFYNPFHDEWHTTELPAKAPSPEDGNPNAGNGAS